MIIKRIGQVLTIGSTTIAFGHILSQESSSSVVLYSNDYGETYKAITVSADSLGSTDKCSIASDGTLHFVDRVGRIWKSSDSGASWNHVKQPSNIQAGAIRELDMIDAMNGVCVDGIRGVYFTTNGWASAIAPLPASRPITRTQPSMLNGFAWSRNLWLVNSAMIMHEGGDYYRTATNDLVWERWDSVVVFAVSPNKKTMAYYTTDNRLVYSHADGTRSVILDTNCPYPHMIRVVDDAVITYRPDTGPIVYSNGRVQSIRPLDSKQQITEPTKADRLKRWGVLTASVDAEIVDVLRADDKGRWHRDTVLRCGPVRSVRVLGTDTVLLNTSHGTTAYLARQRRTIPYTVSNPLGRFLQIPLSRMRISMWADAFDSTHRTWCEYVVIGNEFVCAELVDSTRAKVRSRLESRKMSVSVVESLLRELNDVADRLPTALLVPYTADVQSEMSSILDTLFSTDAYFDTYDVYRPPPAPETQAQLCLQEFKRSVTKLDGMSADTIARALRAFRHVPHDGHSKYAIEFQNKSGRIARFVVDRSDEAHPPLMLPWTGWVDGVEWNSYHRGLTDLFLKGMPSDVTPGRFKDMARGAWFYIGVAAYLDGIRYGRWHRWSDRVVTPAARW